MTGPGRVRAARASAPWGLLGMLALLALGEWAFARVEMGVIAPWHWDWRLAAKAARGPLVRSSGVLCFGDSQVKFGVVPAVVEAVAGEPTYNLAVVLGQPPASYFLLRRALDAGARPKAVVVDATPHLAREGPTDPRYLRQWPEFLGPGEMLDLAWTARDAGFLAAMAAAKVSPTFRARAEVRATVLGALRGEVSERRYTAAKFWRNTRVNRGATVMPTIPLAGDLETAYRFLYSGFVVDPVNAHYLERFLDLADARGIPVVFVLPPLTTEVQQMCDRDGFTEAHSAFVRSLRERHPGLTVVDGRGAGFGQDLHTDDPVHLSRPGALAFSADLAPALRRVLDGETRSGWVTLPAYRPRPDPVPVEDVAASALALRSRAKAVR